MLRAVRGLYPLGGTPPLEVILIKTEMLDFISGAKNAVKGDGLILSRERIGTTGEFIHVSIPDREEPLYRLWNSRSKTKAPKKASDPIPKHTGGKAPYIMLMEGADETISKLSVEAAGILLKLLYAGHVEWHTGRVMTKHNKKSMTLIELTRYFNPIGKKKMRRLLTELASIEAMEYNPSSHAYFISRKIARKGRSL